MSDIKIEPFEWKDDNMSIGITAQEIGTIDLSAAIDLSAISIESEQDYIITSGSNVSDTITISTADYSIDFAPSREEHQEVLNRLDKLEKVLLEEAELRAKHPAVEQAYNEYKLLLTLAKPHSNEVDK